MSQDQGQMFDKQDQPDNGSEGQQEQPQGSMFKVGDREYTPEDAAKKIENADSFIEQLKQERKQDSEKVQTLEQKLAELTSKLDTAAKLEDVVSSKREAPQEQPEPAEQTNPPAVDEDAMLKRFEKYMQEKEKTQSRAQNMANAVDAASKRYGSEWQTKLLEQGKEVGMDSAAIQNMAETSPQAFARLFGLTGSSKSEPDASAGSIVSGHKAEPEAPKPIMFGASTKDLVEQWRYSGKKVGEANEFDYTPDLHKIPKRR